jgi:hypothetical protein
MTHADDVRGQVSGSKGLLERAAMYIPFYGGYRKRNVARDTDREVRISVVRVFKGVKIDLANVHRAVVDTGDMNLARDVERLRTKVDTQSTKIEKAVNGYSGVWATIKKKDEELDAVIDWDVRLLEAGGEIKAMSAALNDMTDGGENVKSAVRELENKVDDLLETFLQRDRVIKGLGE